MTLDAEIKAAVNGCAWLAPLIRREFLNADWNPIGEEGTALCLEAVANYSALMGLLAKEDSEFGALVRRYAEAGEFEADLGVATVQELREQTPSLLAGGEPSFTATYALHQLGVLGALDLAQSGDAAEILRGRLEKAADAAKRLMGLGEWDEAAQRCAAVLGFASMADATADDLVGAIAERCTREGFTALHLVSAHFISATARSLLTIGRPADSLAVIEHYFNVAAGGDAADVRRTLSESWSALGAAVAAAVAEQPQMGPAVRTLNACRLDLVNYWRRAVELLSPHLPSDAAAALAAGNRCAWEAILGYDSSCGELDLATPEFLARNSDLSSLQLAVNVSAKMVEDAGRLPALCSALVEEAAAAREAYGEGADWWSLPLACGRTSLLLTAFLTLARSHPFEETGEFLRGVVAPDDDAESSLGRQLGGHGDETALTLATTLGLMIAVQHQQNGDHSKAIELFEQVLQIEGDAVYGDDEFLRRCRAACFPSRGYRRDAIGCYTALLAFLWQVGRKENAAAVLEALFGVPSRPGELSFDRFGVVWEMQPGLRKLLASGTFEVLRFLNRLPTWLEFMERVQGLPALDQASNAQLREWGARIERECDGNQAVALEIVAMFAIACEARAGMAGRIRLLEGVLGIFGCADEELAARFVPTDAVKWYLAALYLGESYVEADQRRRLLSLLAAASREPNGDVDWFRFRRCFRELPLVGEMFDRIYSPHVAALVVNALSVHGRAEAAIELIRRELPGAKWLAEDGEFDGLGAIGLGMECARLMLECDAAHASELYVELADRLDRDGRGWNWTPFDRITTARSSMEWRQRVIILGHSLLAGGEAGGPRARIRHLVRDSRLAQRSLIERFARGKPRTIVPDGVEPLPENCLAVETPDDVVETADAAPFAVDQFRSVESRPEPLIERDARYFEYDAGAADVRSGGAFEHTLAKSLGENGVLLRAGFSWRGQLVWSLFRAEGRSLRVAAADDGAGPTDARDRIEAALRRFEAAVGGVWDCCEASPGDYERLRRNVMDGDRMRPRTAVEDAGVFRKLGKFRRTQQRLREEWGTPEDWSRDGRPDDAEWEAWWRTALNETLAKRAGDAGELAGLLDGATEALLREAESVWPLQALAEQLRPSDDLRVWVDDALLGLPIPFLRVQAPGGAEQYLFERVECMRTIVSPLWDEAMRRSEPTKVKEMAAREVLSAAWFDDRGDLEQLAERLLVQRTRAAKRAAAPHYEFKVVGDEHGAGGRHDVLARGLRGSRRGAALLVVLGHGEERPRGVRLGDGVWDGSEVWTESGSPEGWNVRGACELSSVDFLVQLSCSIGRLHQSGFQDVQGFCAELFLNRARSVFAGRWPLHAGDSIALGADLTECYLALHADATREGSRLGDKRVRGAAVAEVRRNWARARREGRKAVGLCTMAGMELFGLP